MKVAVLGGGAAGFFAAITVKQKHPEAIVTIFEKSQKLLSKVKVSGGGRCNITNACFSISELSQAYPRGGKQLKKVFPIFNTKHTMQSKNCKGLYFAGEVMDIDAITGGYNFQAAWTTGFIAGQLK